MSTVKIGYPIHVREVPTITTGQDWRDWNPAENLGYGRKSAWAELVSATGSDRTIVYQFSGSKVVDYIYIGRADWLLNQGATHVIVARSTNGADYSTVYDLTLAAELLQGPRKEDIFITFTPSEAATFYRITIQGASAQTRVAKIFIGELLDLNTQPDIFMSEYAMNISGQLEANSGSVIPIQVERPRLRVSLTWDGVDDGEASRIFQYLDSRYDGYVIATTGQHHILNDYQVVYASLDSLRREDVEAYPDWNRITAVFLEYL